MKKRIFAILLTLALVLALLPATAFAAAANPPDWYFLFAIFKNVDTDCQNSEGVKKHTKYTMTQDEIDYTNEAALDFEAYMTRTGVMRAHVDVIEIDTTVTKLAEYSDGTWLSNEEAAPLLKDRVDLDQYDHIFCVASLDVFTGYRGLTGAPFENGTGHSCINYVNREHCENTWRRPDSKFPSSTFVHEFLHFMNRMSKKWGTEFDLHTIEEKFYPTSSRADRRLDCYADIILNRAKGDSGTGVAPSAWMYSPRTLRTMNELAVPSGVAGIGTWAFGNYTALTRVSLPASVTSIGYAAFWNTGIKDVYYGGTNAQWKAIQFDEFNKALTNANIHCNSLMADVKTDDYFAESVAWALENGITNGTGEGNFSPDNSCTQGQISTFLWRANGAPEPAGTVRGNEYYAAAVQWAKEKGLVNEALVPDSPCTRSDVVTYLWKLADSPNAGVSGFTDVAANASYAQAVGWAVSEGVTTGTSETTFSPDSVCTRGQIVTFLYRALG